MKLLQDHDIELVPHTPVVQLHLVRDAPLHPLDQPAQQAGTGDRSPQTSHFQLPDLRTITDQLQGLFRSPLTTSISPVAIPGHVVAPAAVLLHVLRDEVLLGLRLLQLLQDLLHPEAGRLLAGGVLGSSQLQGRQGVRGTGMGQRTEDRVGTEDRVETRGQRTEWGQRTKDRVS